MDKDSSDTNLKSRSWFKRLGATIVLMVIFWLAADGLYAIYVKNQVQKWETGVERNENGVRIGCEAYSIDSESRQAILLIHGLADSPHIYRKCSKWLAGKGFHCRCMRLPGFGESVENYRQSTISDWTEAIDREVESLKDKGKDVILVAHSLGGALAIHYQVKNKGKVDGIVLVAPAIDVANDRSPILPTRYWFNLLSNTLCFTGTTVSPFGIDALDPEAKADNKLRMPFSPVSVIRQIFELIDLNRKAAPEITVPVMLCLAKHDHVIDNAAARNFYEELKSTPKQLVELQNSAHAIPVDFQWKEFCISVADFADGLKVDAPEADKKNREPGQLPIQ